MKAKKVTVNSVAVVTMKFLFGMCNGFVESDIGTYYFSFVLGILDMCGNVLVQSHVSMCGLHVQLQIIQHYHLCLNKHTCNLKFVKNFLRGMECLIANNYN